MKLRAKEVSSTILIVILTCACQGSASLSYVAPGTSASPTPTSSTSSGPTPASGPKAAKIIFTRSLSGSFDTASADSDTTASPGSGFQISRVFNPDNSLLATQTFDSSRVATKSKSWPNWLDSFEIGIRASSGCAKFADSNEILSANCNLGGATKSNCGAPPNQFRISEVDCTASSPVAGTGNGGPSDPVYIRIVFNRSSSYLASNENILVVLEYAASALNPAPENPSDCFSSSSGSFSPERCSDFTWKAYVKTNTTDVVQPFLVLIPPTYSSVLLGRGADQIARQSGSTLTARQFVVPLFSFAYDTNSKTTLQISRINSNFGSANPVTYCTTDGTSLPGNSPLCAGVVFYSLTLYRI
jgi:hypothetical protein